MKFLKILTLTSLLTLTQANAGIIGSATNVEGISDISFGGDLYTANFIDSSCANTFDFCGGTLTTAITASNGNALTSALSLALENEGLNAAMSNIVGINEEPDFDYEYLFAPFQLNPTNALATYTWRLQTFDDASKTDIIKQVNGVDINSNLSQTNRWGNRTVLVQWVMQTPPVNPGGSTSVPEPSTLAIFALSLLALVTRRNIKK